MRFECDSCNAKYKISDEKVRGRVVRFPCRKCDHKILIDGRQHDADVTVPAGEAYSFDDVTRRSEPANPFSAHEAATARARRPSSPPRRRSPSVPPRRATAASRRVSSIPTGTTPSAAAASAFVGEKHALTPPLPDVTTPNAPAVPAAPSERPEWHVSVNDVPIGPIRLEEMGHKIDAGAVSEYSLVWRDGFEDWRPLATVPELMSLLHERRHSGPPPRSTFSSMPPFVDTRASLSDPAPAPSLPATMPAVSAPLSSRPFDEASAIEPLADALQPEGDLGIGLDAVSQPPATLSADEPFHSSPQLGSYSGLPPTIDDEVSVPSTPPAVAVEEAQGDSGRTSLGVWALILAVIVFAGVAGFLAYERFGEQMLSELLGSRTTDSAEPPARARKAAPPAQVAEPVEETEAEDKAEDQAATEAAPADELEGESSDGSDASVAGADAGTEGAADVDGSQAGGSGEAAIVPPPDPKADAPKMAPARAKPKARRRSRPAPTTAAPAPKQVSAEDQKILDEFDSASDAAPAKIAVKQNTGAKSDKPALDGDAVRQTVAENKPRLQRCYERAIRGQTSTDAVRLDVTVQVAPSGRVKSVSASDGGPGGLAACIEASVRRWRFPETSEGGPAKFPLVFSAN